VNNSVVLNLLQAEPRQLEGAASNLGMTPQMAGVLREHWCRRITGHCVKCQLPLFRQEDKGDWGQQNVCPQCGTAAEPIKTFLEEVRPNDIVLIRFCTICGERHSYSADHVLSMYKKYGGFSPSSFCHRCRPPRQQRNKRNNQKGRRNKTPREDKPKTKTKQEPKTTKEPEVIKVAPGVVKTKTAAKRLSPPTDDNSTSVFDTEMVHRPLEALQGLK
jgi:uncharacterized Zn finger protein (UPF0148 family)